MIKKEEVKYEVIAGSTNLTVKDRQHVNKMLKNRELHGVLTTTTYDVGVDVPSIEAVVFAYPFSSSIKTIQRTGRAARQNPGKTRSFVIDINDSLLPRCKIMAEKRKNILVQEFELETAEPIEAYELEEKLNLILKEQKNNGMA